MLRDYLELPLPVRILCLGSLINRAGSFVVIFLTIYASEQMNWGVPFATACMGVFGLGSMVGSILGGQLADAWGRRRVMLIALFGGAALLMLISVAQNRLAFMTAVGLFSLVSEMYRPASFAMIADLVSFSRRPHAFALMYIAINLGFAIAPTVGGLLAEYSYSLLFWGDAATITVYGVIILVLIRETLPAHGVAHDREDSEPVLPLAQAAARIARDTPFLLFCMASFLIALVFMQAMSTLPIYIRQSGLSNIQFGLLMSVNGILIVVFQLPVTHWLSRFNAMSVVLVGGVLIAIGFGLTGLAHAFFPLAITIVIWTAGEILQAPFKHSIVTNLAPVDLRARYLGLFSMCYALALTIGAPLGGVMLMEFGSLVLWSTAFCIALAAIGLYVVMHRAISMRLAAAKVASQAEFVEMPESQELAVTA